MQYLAFKAPRKLAAYDICIFFFNFSEKIKLRLGTRFTCNIKSYLLEKRKKKKKDRMFCVAFVIGTLRANPGPAEPGYALP